MKSKLSLKRSTTSQHFIPLSLKEMANNIIKKVKKEKNKRSTSTQPPLYGTS